SAILLTRFLSRAGVAEVSDFMPITELGHAHDLVRRAKCIRGELTFRMVCQPRFDYGRATHRIERDGNDVIFISEGADKSVLRLRSEVPVKIENGAATAEFCLHSSESVAFTLKDARTTAEKPPSAPNYVTDAFKETMNFWHCWVAKS